MPSSQIESKLCKNCNSELVGLYCSECGQKNSQLLSIKETLKEFTDNVFSFDTRFFITLKYLITKPGLLTTEYWLGRRTKYLPPLRLYLVMSLMYFFSSSIINPGIDKPFKTLDGFFQFELDKSSPKYDPSPEIVAPFVDFFKENFNKGVRVAEKKELTEQDLIWSSMPTAMFILMPFMAFCVYLLNKKKKQLYSYHLITVLHFHSFIFFIFTLEDIVPNFNPAFFLYLPLIDIFIKLYSLYYIFFMFKNIYQDSWIWNSLKLTTLSVLYGITVVITILSVATGTVFLLGYNA